MKGNWIISSCKLVTEKWMPLWVLLREKRKRGGFIQMSKGKNERKKWVWRHLASCPCVLSYPCFKARGPCWRGRDDRSSELKSFLLPVRPRRIPPTCSSALSFAHCALATLVFAHCQASQPLLTLLWLFPPSRVFFHQTPAPSSLCYIVAFSKRPT